VAWMTVLGAALTALGAAFMPGILYTHRFVDNPSGIADVSLATASRSHPDGPADA
jgi:hypothetical protein